MVTRSKRPVATDSGVRGGLRINASVLIIEARYYADIAEELAAGAIAEIEAAGATWNRVAVSGALELPQALKHAVAAGLLPRSAPSANWCGAVLLGCVVRGETTHYETVCTESNRWIMDTAIRHNVPVGNGLLTVETEAQARARARGREGKGGQAAAACLSLIALSRQFQEQGA